ncbi:DUF1932 domain-containing protein [Brevibacillus sp. TJ4]|uniref:NAD(P)-dependent oxidoreductase n=1 Tax=Brevibacillus sp. TJ4 TaxID=3234853 RepID=UPI0037D8C2CE
MSAPRLGFIGFGEAAFYISAGLAHEGFSPMYAFDIVAEDPDKGKQIRERAKTAGVHLFPSLQELTETCDVLLCATSAKLAIGIAKEVAPLIRREHIYVDLNAASPKVKTEVCAIIGEAGGLPVDGAVMDAVPPHGHKVPMFVSGPGAADFKTRMQPYGMNITAINEQAGSASSIKMVRSIFMKGFTSLLVETLTAAHRSGIEREIVASISKTFGSQPMEALMNLLLTRTAIHAERRVAEMTDVIETLRDNNLEHAMSRAARDTLQHLVDLGVKEYFDSTRPDHYLQVIEAISMLKTKTGGRADDAQA